LLFLAAFIRGQQISPFFLLFHAVSTADDWCLWWSGGVRKPALAALLGLMVAATLILCRETTPFFLAGLFFWNPWLSTLAPCQIVPWLLGHFARGRRQ